MKTRTFNRSEIYSYFDLTETEKAEVLDTYYSSIEEAEEDSFIKCGKQVLPLSQFIRCENSRWDAVYGTSYFSGYYIKLNKFGDEALIADRFW